MTAMMNLYARRRTRNTLLMGLSIAATSPTFSKVRP